jgi:hypothetical protein
MGYRQKYNQLMFYWPTLDTDSEDPVSYMRYNIGDGSVAVGTLGRLAEEYPTAISTYPRAVDQFGNLYLHEYGVNADNTGMQWHLETSYIQNDDDVAACYGVIPDSKQTGNIQFTATFKDFPQSSEERTSAVIDITPTTSEVFFEESLLRGHLWKYRLEGYELNGFWRAGNWKQMVKISTPRL